MPADLRQYAGLCEELEKSLAQALAQARVLHFCVRNGQHGPIKRTSFELNKAFNTGIDLLVEISEHLHVKEGV